MPGCRLCDLGQLLSLTESKERLGCVVFGGLPGVVSGDQAGLTSPLHSLTLWGA